MNEGTIRARWRESTSQDLLVLTNRRRRGRHALTLPFREATVMEAVDGPSSGISGTFDTVVIERDDLDADRLADVAAAALAALRPDGHLIVTLAAAPDGSTVDGASYGWLDNLCWVGTTTLGGLPFAVMSAADRGGEKPASTAAASTAARFATAAATVRQLAAIPEASGAAGVSRHLGSRRRSEHALLDHLESVLLAAEASRPRSGLQARATAALRRRRAGRAVLRLARRGRNAVRRARRLAGRAGA